jgi:uncharacterized protein YerC
MTRVSKYPLHKDLKKEMFTVFWSSLSQLHTAPDVAAFFSDLLSDTEEMMLAKRFTISLLLLHGKRPVEVAAILHVSFSTIRSVDEWLSRATPATKRLLERVSKVQGWQTVFDKVEALADQLPPRWGTDWHASGKAKWERKLQRAARSQLR